MTAATITFKFVGHDYTATVNSLDSLRSFAANRSFQWAQVDDAGSFSMAELASAVYPHRAATFQGLPDSCITEALTLDECEMADLAAMARMDERPAGRSWMAWVIKDKTGGLRTSKTHLMSGPDGWPVCGARPKSEVFDWTPSDESDIDTCSKCRKAAR